MSDEKKEGVFPEFESGVVSVTSREVETTTEQLFARISIGQGNSAHEIGSVMIHRLLDQEATMSLTHGIRTHEEWSIVVAESAKLWVRFYELFGRDMRRSRIPVETGSEGKDGTR